MTRQSTSVLLDPNIVSQDQVRCRQEVKLRAKTEQCTNKGQRDTAMEHYEIHCLTFFRVNASLPISRSWQLTFDFCRRASPALTEAVLRIFGILLTTGRNEVLPYLLPSPQRLSWSLNHHACHCQGVGSPTGSCTWFFFNLVPCFTEIRAQCVWWRGRVKCVCGKGRDEREGVRAT